MIRRLSLTVCLMGACFWCLTLVARGAGAEGATAASAFKPVASVHSLMEGQDQHFANIMDLLDNPKAKKRAKHIVVEAEVLAELANVNIRNRDKDDYRAWATAVRDKSLELAKEADKGSTADEKRLRTIYKQINDTCTACHDMYQ